MARVDNNQHHRIVLSARRFIYELTYLVNSAAVETLLREESWVPNVVRGTVFNPNSSMMLIYSRMHFPTDFPL
jgi:hypothetical protein